VSTEKLPVAPPRPGRHREAWVGLFVVSGILATVILLAVMTDAALFRGRYIVTTNVPQAGGIRKGDPVQMRGVNIGRVLGFGFGVGRNDVEIRLEIEGEYLIPKDSKVELKSAGLLGGTVADVLPGTSNERARGGDVLHGHIGPGVFDKVDELAGQADKVAIKLQTILTDDTVKDIKGTASHARTSLDELEQLLKEQRSQLRELTANLRTTSASLHKATSGPELERAVKRMDELTAKMDTTLGTLDRSSKSLESVLGRMDRGEGTLGKLSTDDALYNNALEATQNLSKSSAELQKLMADLQANPKKYINLKIF
jgi:phospholipid/cholesterol/gamma-HCH transport system substrate-binding protein